MFFTFSKVFNLLSMCARFQVNRSSLSEKKKQVCGNFTHPSPRERSRNQNTSLGKVVK